MHSYGGSPLDIAPAIELIRKKTIPAASLITHRLSLKETGKGFELFAQGKDSLKVIIEPHSW